MIELELTHADLARMRFAHSPVWELVASLRTLHDPARRQMYGPWLAAAGRRLGTVNLALLTALAPAGPLMPDFVIPHPTSSWGVLTDELQAVAATPASYVRAELETVYQDRPMPAVLRPLYEDPATQLLVVVAELRAYWQVAVEPIWPRLRALCMADLSYRIEQFGSGGIARVLEGLHPQLSLDRDRLLIDKPHHCVHRVDLDGTGIVLIPCAFSWPTLVVRCCGSAQPLLSYPPRGVATLWAETRPDQADPLAALLGRKRAVLLAALSLPATTTQLARQLNVSPATVSEHLKILKASGLVDAQRHGKVVLYQRTQAAGALLAAAGPDAHGG